MPDKATVVCGVALGLGLLTLSVPAICAESGSAREVVAVTEIATLTDYTDINQAAALQPSLTLEEAIARTLQHSPALAASQREVEARHFEAEQAGYLPNPELSFEVENFAGSGGFKGTDSAEMTVALSQRLELGGKRGHRVVAGSLEKETAERELAQVRAELVAETATRFIDLLAAQDRLSLAEEQAALANKVLNVVNERIASGKTASIKGIRFAALVADAELHRMQIRQEVVTARHALAALWDQTGGVNFGRADGSLEERPSIPAWDELQVMIPQSPASTLSQTKVKVAEQSVAIEKANRIPDLSLSLGAKNFAETDDHALVAGLALDVPLFDRNQGGVGAARVRSMQAREAARATALQLETELRSLLQALQAHHKEADVLRDTLLPAVQQSFDAITYGYRVGKFGYLEVLEAEQTLFETRTRYIDTLAAYHRTFTELERLFGQSLRSDKASIAHVLPNEVDHE